MLDGSAIQKVAELARDGQRIDQLQHEIDGEVYTSVELHHLPPKPYHWDAAPIECTTLSGLVGYAAANRDGLDLSTCVIHVVSCGCVELFGPPVGERRERIIHAAARFDDLAASFLDRRHGQEEFVVGLLSLFTDAGHRARVLHLVQRLKQEQSLEELDDGVTQRATVQKGVSLSENVVVPNPVTLAPHRSFPEIVQPETQFVFRVHDGPMAALYEADGGAWRLEAMGRVASWLRESLEAEELDIPVLA